MLSSDKMVSSRVGTARGIPVEALQRGLAGLCAARRGPYRVGYEIDDSTKTVNVVRIDHRADVYRPR